ncbi:D-alanyl-D-alanine carboxypeptidase/D-alanyl-D-alanine-endopeptidase [Neisseria weixii]|nr:D-alanyl-D-alanine carboxypeptidase/D-alanyl-D-alanine-endopeptidase [Neisseria weixii]ATD65688.1 D-alanyl-D-alanine carboxypeptidase/D-alanyl-D-alanine-endopeptidase [Neisseria weixii]
MKFPRSLAIFMLATFSLPAMALNFGKIRADEISVYVQDLDTGKVQIDYRSDVSVNPASTMKLVTAFAAFQALGKDYRWTTHFKSAAPVVGDTLNGDIYWEGSGDPVLDQDGLIALQQQLRDRGIRNIAGQLVLDRSLWGDIRNSKEFAADEAETYMTPPDPNRLAYKVVAVKGERNPLGDIVWTTNPPLPNIKLDNQTTIIPSAAECKSINRYMSGRYSGGALIISGNVPETCLSETLYVNMLTSQDFAYRSFINQWRAAGGTISDGLKVAATPPEAKTLASLKSKPLSEILADMNKFSNNLIARSVFLKLGQDKDLHEALHRADSAVKLELGMAGVDTTNLVLENGSGLSRKERVTAKMMGQLLEQAYFSRYKEEFINTLPIAGVDGTLKTRLKQAGDNLRLKTGTLKNVRALAGYWLGEQPKVVVVVINSPNSDAYVKDMDRLVSEIVLPGGKSWVALGTTCEARQDV